MTSIERCDGAEAKPLGGSDYRCIDGTQWQVGIAGHQLGHSQPVLRLDLELDKSATGQIAEETDLGRGSQAGSHEVGDLSDRQDGHEYWPRVIADQLECGGVMLVVGIDIRV
jgi:hypothetical protein